MRFVTSFVGIIVMTAGAVAGCSAGNDQAAPSDVGVADPSPTAAPGGNQAATTPDDRGVLVKTIATSAETRATTGVTTWAVFKKGHVATMYGFDAKGGVRTQVAAATNPAGTEMKIGAPGAGVLHLRNDGTVIANTLDAAKVVALPSMQSDSAAQKRDAAYSFCVDPWLDFSDVLERIQPVSCVPSPDPTYADNGWCAPPRPFPPRCTPPDPVPEPYPIDPPLCLVACAPGLVLDGPCQCVDPWQGWDL